jgi:hypothetical protein
LFLKAFVFTKWLATIQANNCVTHKLSW